MATSQIIVYALAIAFTLLWVGVILHQRAEVQKKSVEMLKEAARTGLGYGESLVFTSLGILGLILFLGALWFTIGPFFYPSIVKPLSINHIAGAMVDWAAVLVVSALISNLEKVSDTIRLILSGDPPGRFDFRGTEGIRANARQFNNIQPKDETSFPAARRGQESEKPFVAPATIEREIPDSWV